MSNRDLVVVMLMLWLSNMTFNTLVHKDIKDKIDTNKPLYIQCYAPSTLDGTNNTLHRIKCPEESKQ